MIKLHKFCPMCDGSFTIDMTEDEFMAFREYEDGKGLVQEALPHYNPMEREFVKTGYCPKCQSMLFGTTYKSKKIKEEK